MGAATGPQEPTPAYERVQGDRGGSGREGGGVPVANTDHETPALQPPRVKPAHPICMHQLCESLRLSVTSSLPEPAMPLALPRLVNLFAPYRRPRRDKTKASPSIYFSQGSHTTLQSSLVSSQPAGMHEVLMKQPIAFPLSHAIVFPSFCICCL